MSSTTIAALQSAQYPRFDLAEDATYTAASESSAPSGDVGVSVEDSLFSLVMVTLKYDPTVSAQYVGVDSVLDSTTYTVTIDSTDVTYDSDASATEEEILLGIAEAVIAESGFSAKVLGGLVRIWKDDGSSFTLSTDANTLEYGEATSVTFAVWALPNIEGAADPDYRERWSRVGESTVTISSNYIQRWGCGGLSRMYVEITDSDGVCITSVGPCKASAGEATVLG